MQFTRDCGTFQRFTDVALDSLMERLRDELMRRQASPLFEQGIAQAIAIHLVRNYAETIKESSSGSPALPGYKVRQITEWMAEHLPEDCLQATTASSVERRFVAASLPTLGESQPRAPDSQALFAQP